MKHCFPLNLSNSELILGVFGTGDNVLGIHLQNDQLLSFLPDVCVEGRIKKIQSTQNSRYLIVLDEKKHLYIICTFTLLIINKYNTDIEDFILLEFKDCQKMDSKIAVLKFSESSWWFQICLFPSLDVTYNLHLNDYAILVTMPSNQDSIYVVDGLKKNEIGEEHISQLRVKSIEDTLPERRLIY
ncbi:uncharacterized protein LOC111612665 [Centruroides sculpturatus]|uniref:uncharacterized protein LOC111612665 n=1 Tax=Centruroides sculpturatus TaxID=218467 RepID=UPI000C6E7164|nr:uncharacterized protein LOC111612665 [Centruroides sculpturatus]